MGFLLRPTFQTPSPAAPPALLCGLAPAILVSALLLPGAGGAYEPKNAAVHVDQRSEEDGFVLVARNESRLPAVVHVELESLQNLEARPGPAVTVEVPAGQEAPILEARARNLDRPWEGEHRWWFCWGRLGAVHDDTVRYLPPFDPSTPRLVVLGPDGWPTHRDEGRWAWDFEMPIGAQVRAARSGQVALTEDRFRIGGPARWLADRANYVIVRHEDGTFATYAHLRPGGVAVEPGQQVAAGQLLGWAGKTGLAPEPHLHFSVWRPTADGRCRSLPVRFDDGTPAGRLLAEDDWLPPRPDPNPSWPSTGPLPVPAGLLP